jgi:hypothetical protein
MLRCDETPGCVAVVAPTPPDGCGYLKTKGTRDAAKADKGFTVVTAAVKPPKINFSALGGFCSGDAWADEVFLCGGNHNPCVNNKCESGYPSGRKLL